ncbi:endonuclease VII domain-containing protein [Microbacterium enclense]|uniref:endonuclease domain-containing protein n=1 Tax=Microbacterium enclense TaxID=993073 RepID=UPI00203B8B38|nr:endonuclease domain-containing protein [Microbacterium enclense]MCM3615727.1 endonuclease VII domain-containing protein [Microbacterium enclense]
MTEKVTTPIKRIYTNKVERSERLSYQSGKCLICVRNDATDLDHNHRTGARRGYLCRSCNTALGMNGDSEARLLARAEREPLNAVHLRRMASYLNVFGSYAA